MSKELNKALELLREIRPSIPKDVLELWCKDRDAFLASHMETVEQAGGDERAVDGKPRATKCPDCGEGDLMPGDLCACGYETDPAAGYACSECDGSGDGYVGEVCRECDGSGWFVTPEQARAALAQPSGEVVVTKNESGAIVSVTRQDKEGRVLSVIAESATLTAQAEQAEAERPEVVATMYTHHDDVDFREFVVVGNCDKGCEGFYGPEKLMTVAQYDRIVGELRAVIAQLRQHKNDYMDSGQETYRALQNEIREREAEIARLDGLVSGRTAERDAALAEVERLRQFERICEGLPQDAIDGGWTVQGIRRYAKRLEDQLKVALARVAELERELSNEENAHTTTIEQRDNAEHWADQLANAIAERFGVDIGEHSNLNCPWNEALVWMQQLPAPAQHSVPQAWLDVQAERRRQITAEGWTPDHDDLYCAAELPRAAAAYILSGANDEAPAIWPFSAKWWKPRDARANYMRAGALILAEIERLDRAAAAGKEVGHE